MRAAVRALLPVALLASAALAGCLQGVEGSGALRGQVAPAFHLVDLEGEPVGTDVYAGQLVFVDFMGARCATCRTAMRVLVPLEEEFGDRVAFLSIDVGSHVPGLGGRSQQELADFRDFFNAPWPFAMDTVEQATAARYEVAALPSVYLIDAQGVLACRAAGVHGYEQLAGWFNHTLAHGYDPAFKC